MSDLAGFRDYATDDGEEFWNVDVTHALEAVMGEMKLWPRVRLLNPSTGEIFEGALRYLIHKVAEGVRNGQSLRVEPVAAPPVKETAD